MYIEDGDYEFVEESENFKITHENGKSKIEFTLGSLGSFAIYSK